MFSSVDTEKGHTKCMPLIGYFYLILSSSAYYLHADDDRKV